MVLPLFLDDAPITLKLASLSRCPDITLAKEKLNWHPKVGLEEGLGRTIEYFKTEPASITVRYNKIVEEMVGDKRLKRKVGKIKARLINI